MTNPYRAMCAELVELSAPVDSVPQLAERLQKLSELADRARALLDQPVAEGPTDEEIEEWADACSEAPLEEMDPEVHGWRRCFTAKEFGETIRAALARWGRPTPQPPADGEVAELAARLKAIRNDYGVKHSADCQRAADLLERLASDNAGLEAAAESAYLDNLSLLDSQND